MRKNVAVESPGSWIVAVDDRVPPLAGRNVHIIRKWGSWENWQHDSAVITAHDRRYIIVGLTNHPKGDDYLIDLARAVDDLMLKR